MTGLDLGQFYPPLTADQPHSSIFQFTQIKKLAFVDNASYQKYKDIEAGLKETRRRDTMSKAHLVSTT